MRPIALACTIAGLVLFLAGHFTMVVGGIYTMIDSFKQVATSETASPAMLAQGMQAALYSTWIGVGIAGVGAVLMVLGVVIMACSGARR
jgi:hypothetical protein